MEKKRGGVDAGMGGREIGGVGQAGDSAAAPDWGVQVVDNPEEACAMFARDLVRVQRHWWEAVYEPGLHSVIGQVPP